MQRYESVVTDERECILWAVIPSDLTTHINYRQDQDLYGISDKMFYSRVVINTLYFVSYLYNRIYRIDTH